MGFNFESMVMGFEKIQAAYDVQLLNAPATAQTGMPNTAQFLEAMGEVLSLFEILGSAFTFVRRDIEKKLAILSRYYTAFPETHGELSHGVRSEMDARIEETGGALGDEPGFSRTILRLMWALKFTDRLLEGLGRAFDAESDLKSYDRTLRWAVGRAYEEALAEHHSWTIRRTVKSACLLLPSKETFLDRIGVEENRREEYLDRLAGSMSKIVERMYAFYEKHGLLALP